MDQDAYRRKGVAALIAIKGDIEGRVILDLSPEVAMKVATILAGDGRSGSQRPSGARNGLRDGEHVIGNSVTLLNDQGFHFKVFPPEIHVDETGLAGSADTEALVICIRRRAATFTSTLRCTISIVGALRRARFRPGLRREWLGGSEKFAAAPLKIDHDPCMGRVIERTAHGIKYTFL